MEKSSQVPRGLLIIPVLIYEFPTLAAAPKRAPNERVIIRQVLYLGITAVVSASADIHGNDDADYWPIVVERFQRLRAAAEQIAAAAAALDQTAVIKAVVSAATATIGDLREALATTENITNPLGKGF